MSSLATDLVVSTQIFFLCQCAKSAEIEKSGAQTLGCSSIRGGVSTSGLGGVANTSWWRQSPICQNFWPTTRRSFFNTLETLTTTDVANVLFTSHTSLFHSGKWLQCLGRLRVITTEKIYTNLRSRVKDLQRMTDRFTARAGFKTRTTDES